MNANPQVLAGAVGAVDPLGGKPRTRPSTLVQDRPLIIWDLDGVILIPDERRFAAYVVAVQVVNELLRTWLPRPIKTLDQVEFWRLFRHYGDIARVMLHGIPLDSIPQRRFVERNIREEFDAAVAEYLPEHMALDKFPETHRIAVRRARAISESFVLTFRSFPERQIPHLVEKGVIRPGDGLFRDKEVFVVGGGQKAALAKAQALLLNFRDVIAAHHSVGIAPMLNGDEVSDLQVARMLGLWFVGFTETGVATRETFEAECQKMARESGIPRDRVAASFFDSVDDPRYLAFLERVCQAYQDRCATRAFWAPPTSPSALIPMGPNTSATSWQMDISESNGEIKLL